MAPELLCSDCFSDRGLAVEAQKIGRVSESKCPNCGSLKGAKLSEEDVFELARQFFIYGSFLKTDYGGASVLQFGEGIAVEFPTWLEPDVALLRSKCGLAFRLHGPRTWRIGEVIPLERLKDESTRQAAAEDVIARFPRRPLSAGETFYRLRKGIEYGNECKTDQYDAPPEGRGEGRLNGAGLPVLYGSQDLEICIHECRVTVADVCHLATLRVTQPLELLDLCAQQVPEDGSTPFESAWLAINYVFSAEEQSYEIARSITRAAKEAGLHGIAYPSYFRLLRGSEVPNLALFGYPIAEGKVELICANRLMLNSARYKFGLGPCFSLSPWWADET